MMDSTENIALTPLSRRVSEDIANSTVLRRRTVAISVGGTTQVEDDQQAVENWVPANRVEHFQYIFGKIGERLPPQISRRHIRAISVGGAIGTGVFVGIGTSLRHAGPLGTLIAYIITGSVVWSVVVSIGEMISFLPNVGGPVGIASLYVDPALGFALGWNAWYNWAIVLPTELSAATILVTGLLPPGANVRTYNWITTVGFLICSIFVNCFGARAYGEFEFVMSCVKIITMVTLVITCVVLNIIAAQNDPVSQSFFRYWVEPGPFVQYRGIPGTGGQVLGVWTTMMQACFSFFGSDIPAVAAGEVKNPHENIPKAVKKVWIRIFLFYITSALVVGLVVRSDDCRLGPSPLGDQLNSTDVTALRHNINTTIGVMVYWSNRVTCFLPLGKNVTDTGNKGSDLVATSPFIIALQDLAPGKALASVATVAFILSAWSAATSDIFISSRYLFFLAECGQVPFAGFFRRLKTFHGVTIRNGTVHRSGTKTIIPWACLLVSFTFGLFSLMSSSSVDAIEVFHWLSSMTSATALLSWIGMSFTYLRWYRGTVKEAERDPLFRERHQKHIYKNRNPMQPYVAMYGLIMCILIVLLNGWYLFTRRDEPWVMASEPNDPPPIPDPDIGQVVPAFVSSFLPVPFFLLCLLGYKLVYRSKLVHYEDMPWTRGNLPNETSTEFGTADIVPRRVKYPWLKVFIEWMF